MSHQQKTKESINHALEALEAETHEVVRGSIRLNENLVKAGKKIWRQVLVIWAVGIVLVISYFTVLNHKPAATHQTHKQLAAQQAAGVEPATDGSTKSSQPPSKVSQVSPTSEQEGLVNLLDQIREAQLKKDIRMFMGAYSPDFPELNQKRETTLSIWKKYTYVDSQFKLSDLQQENPLTIIGKVEWNIKAKEQGNGAAKMVKRSYLVTFSKQSGKWLIQNINKIDKIAN